MSGGGRRATPFWLRPKWLVGHVLVVVLVAGFVSLGFWQLDRLDHRRDRNASIAARAALDPEPVADLVAPGTGLGDVDDLEFRRVTATGTYDRDGEVLVRPRSLDGVSGWHVVTPLVLADGRAVLVNRGFVPLGPDPEGARQAAAPPPGEVVVDGLAFPTQERGGIGPTDPEEGTLRELARIDIARVQQQYARDVLPVHVQLVSQQPAGPGFLPQVIPPPATDEGPHLSYAVQWFLFALVGVVGWPVLLRHTAREHRHPVPPPAEPDAGGGVPPPPRPGPPVGARRG